jgi:hypothetical protein
MLFEASCQFFVSLFDAHILRLTIDVGGGYQHVILR